MQTPTLTSTNPLAPLSAPNRRNHRSGLQGSAVSVICGLSIMCATLVLKLSIPPFSDRGISISLFLLPAVAFVGFALRALGIDATRLAIFLLLTGALSVISLFGVTELSVSSLAMFTVVHLPFVFGARPTASTVAPPLDRVRDGTATSIHSTFLNLALVLAWCGIAQFFLQSVIDVRFLFPIENFFPSSLVVQHFNSQGIVEYGSQTYRANGVFLPEPSFFSQLMGIAIVLELCLKGRWHRLAVYGVALLAAAAGTGLLILAICVPLLIMKRARWDLLLLAAAAIAVVGALGDSSYAGHLASRAGEFNANGSSAFARFIGGFYLFDQFLWNDPWRTLFGFGAGSFSELASHAHYSVAEMPVFKMILEFGLLGALLYFLVIGYFLFSSPAPKLLSLAIAIAFLLNGIYAAFAQALALGLLVWPFASARSTSRVDRAATTPAEPGAADRSWAAPPSEVILQGGGCDACVARVGPRGQPRTDDEQADACAGGGSSV
jgi:hypothetical protein